jgi:hypothetical protein
MRMNILAAQDKAKRDTGNIGDLNLAAVKLKTVLMTKLPLFYKVNLICKA